MGRVLIIRAASPINLTFDTRQIELDSHWVLVSSGVVLGESKSLVVKLVKSENLSFLFCLFIHAIFSLAI